jgi:hypothetical protein
MLVMERRSIIAYIKIPEEVTVILEVRGDAMGLSTYLRHQPIYSVQFKSSSIGVLVEG